MLTGGRTATRCLGKAAPCANVVSSIPGSSSWAPFFVLSSREKCSPNAASCRPLESLEARLKSGDGATNWTPWRCCIDYLPTHLNYGMAIVYDSRRVTFFEALIQSLTQPFFVNFGCFLFILIVIFAHGFWLCERGANADNFPRRWTEGIDDALWFSVVTITTGAHVPAAHARGVSRPPSAHILLLRPALHNQGSMPVRYFESLAHLHPPCVPPVPYT